MITDAQVEAAGKALRDMNIYLSEVALRAAFEAAEAAALKDGWKLVPLKPTKEMVERGQGCLDCVPIDQCQQQAYQVWRGMWHAASDPPDPDLPAFTPQDRGGEYYDESPVPYRIVKPPVTPAR